MMAAARGACLANGMLRASIQRRFRHTPQGVPDMDPKNHLRRAVLMAWLQRIGRRAPAFIRAPLGRLVHRMLWPAGSYASAGEPTLPGLESGQAERIRARLEALVHARR